jgi:hypothetical protein
MKKTSVISVAMIFIVIVTLAFTIKNTTSESQNPNTTVRVHVENCSNCSSLHYCLDDSAPVNVGTCLFNIECGSGMHTICVTCEGLGAMGTGISFNCGDSKDIYINCDAAPNCDCGNKKK